MMPNDPNQHWMNLNNQVSQYQQASNMNQPDQRQVMTPQDREMVKSQQNDQFTLGAMGVQAQREGNRMQADTARYAADSQERTWANKNQLDFENAERDRQFQQANIDKEREAQNNRAQSLMQAFEKASQARLDAARAREENAQVALEKSNALRQQTRDLERAHVTAELRFQQQRNRDVTTPLNQKLSELRGIQRHRDTVVDLLAQPQGALAASLGNFVSGVLQNRFTDAPAPGFWETIGSDLGLMDTAADLAAPDVQGRYATPLSGVDLSGFDSREAEVASGVRVMSLESMAREVANGLSTTLSSSQIGGKFSGGTGPLVDRIATVLVNSALGTRNNVAQVKEDYAKITADLRAAGVSPHVVPVLFEQAHSQLVSAAMFEQERLVGLLPSVAAGGLLDSNGNLRTISPSSLSAVDARDFEESRSEIAKYNALAVMANAARNAGIRATQTGEMYSADDLIGQIRMFEDVSRDMGSYSFTDALSGDGPVQGELSTSYLDTMMSRYPESRPAWADKLYELAGANERLVSEGRAERRRFRSSIDDLEDQDELLQLELGRGRNRASMDEFAQLASIAGGMPTGDLDPESALLLLQILGGGR